METNKEGWEPEFDRYFTNQTGERLRTFEERQQSHSSRPMTAFSLKDFIKSLLSTQEEKIKTGIKNKLPRPKKEEFFKGEKAWLEGYNMCLSEIKRMLNK